jgi:hypothetical protein
MSNTLVVPLPINSALAVSVAITLGIPAELIALANPATLLPARVTQSLT